MQIKKPLFSLGAVALTAVALTLIAPRAAHAVAAALVQVTNTVANPAITQGTEKQAAQLVTLLLPGDSNISPGQTEELVQNFYATGANPNAFVVPAGQNFVLTELDVSISTVTSGGGISVASSSFSIESAYFVTSGYHQMRFSSGIVFPAGSSVYVTPISNSMNVFAHGYLTAN